MAGHRVDRFCNNPTCESCDLLLRPQDTLKKGGVEVCPRCLEEMIVRARRPSLSVRSAAPPENAAPRR